MINGAHVIVYSKKPEADRELFREVLGLPHVDVGGGWLIFALPPSEVAFHPGENDTHELYLLCDDVEGFIASMHAKQVACSPIREERWGRLTKVALPGGGKLGVYQAKHERAHATAPAKNRKAAASTTHERQANASTTKHRKAAAPTAKPSKATAPATKNRKAAAPATKKRKSGR